MYKVTEKDLIGQLRGFPIEVVQKMIERQVEQGNPADVRVFQDPVAAGIGRGFYWRLTPEDFDFWNDVILRKDFSKFFERYPKQTEPEEEEDYWIDPKGRRMLVWDDIVGEENAQEALVIAKLPGETRRSYIAVSEYDEHNYKKGLYYVPHAYQYAKPIPAKEEAVELTLDQIAEKFGISVDRLKIKKL